jgi:hypothetical protein
VAQKTVVMVMLAILLQWVEIDVTRPALWEELCDLVTGGTTDTVLQVVQLQQTCHGSTARRRINITTSLRGCHPCTQQISPTNINNSQKCQSSKTLGQSRQIRQVHEAM